MMVNAAEPAKYKASASVLTWSSLIGKAAFPNMIKVWFTNAIKRSTVRTTVPLSKFFILCFPPYFCSRL
ncbi:hypothetical protein CHCC15091_2938 [Bacillus licheniformis]|nr:hypothetical protein CHCC15091_2938 [Bacillus licheniformis]